MENAQAMVEREMQELLWRYPERFLNEPLKQLAWKHGPAWAALILCLKQTWTVTDHRSEARGKLPRGAIDQLLDYFGMMKQRFPAKPVELMVVANEIPSERRLTCESRDIECREISEKTFRNVALEVAYAFVSEAKNQPRQPSESSAMPSVPRGHRCSKGERRHLKLVIWKSSRLGSRCW